MSIEISNELKKQLKNKNTNFNNFHFMFCENQLDFLKNFLLNNSDLTELKDIDDEQIIKLTQTQNYYNLKYQLRNIDWDFLSGCSMLQDEFILGVITTDYLYEESLIYNKKNFLNIKIFHYLDGTKLCKYNNLSNYYNSETSSFIKFNQNTYNTDLTNNYIQTYQLYLNLFEQDAYEYSVNYYPQNISTSLVQYDYDFKQKKCVYQQRIYDKANINYYSIDQKYKDDIVIYNRIIQNNKLTDNFSDYYISYVTNSIRNIGLNKNELLKNQNISFEFAKNNYSIQQICRYIPFTKDVFLTDPNGIDNQSYDFQTLFKWQFFNTNDESFIYFFNLNYENGNISQNELLYFGIYQKINESDYSNYSISSSSLTAIEEYVKKLAYAEPLNNAKYDSTFVLPNNISDISLKYNYGIFGGGGVLSQMVYQLDSNIPTTDNIILTNVNDDNKITILNNVGLLKGTVFNNLYSDCFNDNIITLYCLNSQMCYDYYNNDIYQHQLKCTNNILQDGQNIILKKFTSNKDYFIVSTKQHLMDVYNINSLRLTAVEVNVTDVDAILENKCLAVRRVVKKSS